MEETFNSLRDPENFDEHNHYRFLSTSNSPDLLLASLACLAEIYENSDDDELGDECAVAFERVFRLIAETAGLDPEAFLNQAYRAVIERASHRHVEIFEGHQRENPFLKIERLEDLVRLLTASGKTAKWDWPEINPAPGSGPFTCDFKRVSALKLFGYSVGISGWSEDERHRFLSDFMEKELPPSVEKYFGEEYGQPMSTDRLRKVAKVIAGNCGLRMRSDPERYETAIREWQDDLKFLKEKYYQGKGLKFVPWPHP